MTTMPNQTGVDAPPQLFAMNDTGGLGAAVAARLGGALALHEERNFEDGEHKTRALASVRERDVYVLAQLHDDHGASVNDKLVRLLFFLGALKDAGARRVTAVVPLLPYARKDQRSQIRDPVTTRYVAGMFESAGTDRVVTLDVHNLAAFENAYRCATEHLTATNLFVDYFASIAGGRELAVVSPDAGGIKRADRFRQRLEAALGRPIAAAFAEKHRAGGVVRGEALVGDVRGRTAIIFDDLVGTGTTLVRTAKSCIEAGAVTVFAAATHGLFVGEADSLLGAAPIERVVVTDSVPPFRLVSDRARAKLVGLTIVPLIAAAIERMNAGGSVSALLAPR